MRPPIAVISNKPPIILPKNTALDNPLTTPRLAEIKKVNPLTNMVCEVNSKLYLTLK